MLQKRVSTKYDQRAVRDWTLYVIRFTDDSYYVGITARKDFMLRIHQHGRRSGARVNRGKTVDEIVEIQHLGETTGQEAGRIENDMALMYRKMFGYKKVRGGYDIFQKTSIVPSYTPGSWQSNLFILVCLSIAVILLLFVAK